MGESTAFTLITRIIVVFSMSLVQVHGNCLPGWVAFEGSCYFVSPNRNAEKLTFHDAQASCQSRGVELTSIHNAQEDQFIFQLMKDRQHQILWLGLHDTSTEGSFEWTDGTPLDYSNWKPNEPNDYKRGEDCVDISSYSVGPNNSTWNDRNCTSKMAYTCKQAATICPEDITTVIELGKTGAKVMWNEPVTTELSEPLQIKGSHEPGTEFPPGVTSVVYTLTDTSDNTVDCSFAVTVETVDTTPPDLTQCPESFTSPALQYVTWKEPVAFDLSGVENQSQSHSPGMFLSVPIDVVYTFTDSSANTAYCRFSIMVGPPNNMNTSHSIAVASLVFATLALLVALCLMFILLYIRRTNHGSGYILQKRLINNDQDYGDAVL